MRKDYPELRRELLQSIGDLKKDLPDPMKAFADLGASVYRPGALEAKHKELIALAIAIAGRCDGCIGFHARGALVRGASREEVLETIGVAIQMGGGPSMIYGTQAMHAFDQFAAEPKKG